ncbi:MAG: porin [Proteobacteria bacterium]|nr:porin [Pseudomonadota bacterium]
MRDRTASRQLAATIAGLLAFGGYAGHAWADERSDRDLRDQVKALQKQVEELTKKVNGGQGGSAQAPKAVAEPSPPSNAKAPEPAPKTAGPPPISWNGITFYGTIDIGVAYLTHGAPLSPSYAPGLPFTLQSFSNHPITSLAPNGLSQSKVGISGVEPLGVADLKGIFKLETGFNPTSGRLVDGPKSLIENNGRPNNQRVTASDSSRAGQAFQGPAYVGIASNLLGILTFGRQNSLMADDLLKYDPQLQAQAFSPIAYSGTSGGLGDTEDKALDDTIKYTYAYGPARIAVLYQFGQRGTEPEGAESVDVGADYAGLSVDALYGEVRGAVSASSLTAAQNAVAPGTLAGTISDNTAYALMGTYTRRPLEIYAGYEHMKYADPKDPLPVGTVTIGGYVLSVVNNTAFKINKILEYSWTGARYAFNPKFDVTAAYYHFKQNSFNANHCSNTSATSCSGLFHDASLVADYRWTRRFDTYGGVNYSSAADGLASGFLFKVDWAPMLGARFNF